MKIRQLAWPSIAAALLAGCATPQSPTDPALAEKVERVIRASYSPNLPPEHRARLHPDAAQAQCNAYRNNLPKDLAAKMEAEQRATIVYPADGKLMGDWKEGAKMVNSGYGGRIGRNTDSPKRPNGANCYACHGLDPKEVAYGTIGPNLKGFGKLRGASESVVKYTYEKIYNAWAFVPCSNMPRMGANKFLTPEQIAHVTAYLLHPDSPVNK